MADGAQLRCSARCVSCSTAQRTRGTSCRARRTSGAPAGSPRPSPGATTVRRPPVHAPSPVPDSRSRPPVVPWRAATEGHKGTKFAPLKWVCPEVPQTLYPICSCKYTERPPYCDGSRTRVPRGSAALPAELTARVGSRHGAPRRLQIGTSRSGSRAECTRARWTTRRCASCATSAGGRPAPSSQSCQTGARRRTLLPLPPPLTRARPDASGSSSLHTQHAHDVQSASSTFVQVGRLPRSRAALYIVHIYTLGPPPAPSSEQSRDGRRARQERAGRRRVELARHERVLQQVLRRRPTAVVQLQAELGARG